MRRGSIQILDPELLKLLLPCSLSPPHPAYSCTPPRSGWVLRFGDLVCFSLKKRQQQPKAAKHSPSDPHGPRQATVPGERGLKKPAIASSPNALAAFSAQDLASGLFRSTHFLPSLLQEKRSDPSLKFCPSSGSIIWSGRQARPHGHSTSGGAAPQGFGTGADKNTSLQE